MHAFCTGTQHALWHNNLYLLLLLIVTIVEVHVLILDVCVSKACHINFMYIYIFFFLIVYKFMLYRNIITIKTYEMKQDLLGTLSSLIIEGLDPD